jgi:AcrR family transcriptional regulator
VASERRSEIVRAARAILEEHGRDALTMRNLGDRLGVKAPSLYKHVGGKDELEALLIAEALDEIGTALADAAAAVESDRLDALAAAYRSYALAHPHLYRLATEQPLPRERLPEGLEARAGAPVLEVTGDRDRARALWAFAHGMVHLELAGRFPPGADLDAAWRAGLAGFARPQTPARTIVRSWRGPD